MPHYGKMFHTTLALSFSELSVEMSFNFYDIPQQLFRSKPAFLQVKWPISLIIENISLPFVTMFTLLVSYA